MRRFGRITFNLAAAASLAACLLVACFALVLGERGRCAPWISVGSLIHFYPDRQGFSVSNAGRYEASANGYVLFPTTEPRATSHTPILGVGDTLSPSIVIIRSRGLRTGTWLWAIYVKYVPFCIVLLGFPLLWVLGALVRLASKHEKAVREERLRFNGRCVQCGYDLRGLRDQCPECGQAFFRRRVGDAESRP